MSNISFKNRQTANKIEGINLTLRAGDAFCICTDSPADAHLLFRGIATLEIPETGRFFFKEKLVDFSDDASLLSYKKNVGYLASDATLINKASAFENLMLMRYYFEDSVAIEMTEQVRDLCRFFDMEGKLGLYPWQLDLEENRIFVIIRELAKNPQILLIDRPGDYLRQTSLDRFKTVLKDYAAKQTALVLHSAQQDFIKAFCHKQIHVRQEGIRAADFQPCDFGNHE